MFSLQGSNFDITMGVIATGAVLTYYNAPNKQVKKLAQWLLIAVAAREAIHVYEVYSGNDIMQMLIGSPSPVTLP